MNSRIRLGPLAIFLAIITIILAMLGLLNYVTSTADAALAERYARVTATKYELEQKGSIFVSQADSILKGGGSLTENGINAQDEKKEKEGKEIYTHIEQTDGYTLTVDYSCEAEGIRILRWRISKDWEEQNVFENILH